eukprot:4633452-Amphidinium_carterae.1
MHTEVHCHRQTAGNTRLFFRAVSARAYAACHGHLRKRHEVPKDGHRRGAEGEAGVAELPRKMSAPMAVVKSRAIHIP